MNQIAIPKRLQARPVDQRGFVVPWFVWFDETGKPDFRVIGHGKFSEAVMFDKCWLCGQPLGRFKTLVLGPLSAIQRISGEPPSHHDCAAYAVQVCPFIANPTMQRSPKALPGGTAKVVSADIPGNPSVYALTTVREFEVFQTGRQTPSGDGLMLRFSNPLAMEWFRSKRRASRDEVMEAIDRNIPALAELFGARDMQLFRKRRQEIIDTMHK